MKPEFAVSSMAMDGPGHFRITATGTVAASDSTASGKPNSGPCEECTMSSATTASRPAITIGPVGRW